MASSSNKHHYRCDVKHCPKQGYTSDAQEREYIKLDHELDSGHDRWTTADASPDWMTRNRNPR